MGHEFPNIIIPYQSATREPDHDVMIENDQITFPRFIGELFRQVPSQCIQRCTVSFRHSVREQVQPETDQYFLHTSNSVRSGMFYSTFDHNTVTIVYSGSVYIGHFL
jgi:hypothetical protein